MQFRDSLLRKCLGGLDGMVSLAGSGPPGRNLETLDINN